MKTRVITRVSEYAGEPVVQVAPTQLDPEFTRPEASRILSEWIEFLADGPSPIQDLQFKSRTPKRLFEALAGQTQLKRLSVKWGDFDDLTALAGMARLEELTLGGASSVRSLEPLAALGTVQTLAIESLLRVSDLSPIGSMPGVVRLELGGDWMSHRIAHVDSIAFLRQMPQLRRFLLHTLIVDDLDYSPVLALPILEAVRVMKARGMRPRHEDLVASTPWER